MASTTMKKTRNRPSKIANQRGISHTEQQRKKKSSKNQEVRHFLPHWLPYVFCFTLGFMTDWGIGVIEQQFEPTKPNRTPSNQPDAEKVSQFEFYTLLPEKEVYEPIHEQQTKTQPHKATPKPAVNQPKPESTKALAQATTDRSRYSLQAGSFRQIADAQKLRAKLLLLGFAPKIHSVELPESGTWHRVQLGPYQGKAAAEQIRRELSLEQMNTLLFRHKP